MNEFTKEELKYISTGVKCVYTFNACKEEMEPLKNLIDKIQTMIDNYCEHNFIGHGEGKYCFPYCNKCCQLIPIPEKIENDNQ